MIAEPAPPATLRRARLAYELGMLRLGATRAACVGVLLAALIALRLASPPPPAFLVAALVVWIALGWRGAIVWRGALGGLGWGLVAVVLPMSLLRPCCVMVAGVMRCSMPGVCAGAGLALGVAVALTLPKARSRSEWAQAIGGAMLGAGSLVACRCVDLLLGETLGLAGGLLASAAAVSLARAWWAGRSLAPR